MFEVPAELAAAWATALSAVAPYESLDDLAADAEAAAEVAAEGAWLRAAEYDPNWVGSEEEARERWLDSLAGR